MTDANERCVNDSSDAIEKCIDPIVEKHKGDSSEEKSQAAYTITADHCHDFEKVENCFTDNLNKCAPDVSTLIRDFFNIFWAELPCKNLNDNLIS